MIKTKRDVYDILDRIHQEGDTWHDTIPGPDPEVLLDVFRVFEYVWECRGLLPKYVVQTVEKGIYLEYRNGHNVIIELYNEGDAALLVMDKKGRTIEAIDVPVTEERTKIICDLLIKILKE